MTVFQKMLAETIAKNEARILDLKKFTDRVSKITKITPKKAYHAGMSFDVGKYFLYVSCRGYGTPNEGYYWGIRHIGDKQLCGPKGCKVPKPITEIDKSLFLMALDKMAKLIPK